MHYFLGVIVLIMIAITGCRQIDVYEKMANIPRHEWARNYAAVVEIDVKDSAFHNLFFLIRHTEKFEFTNIVTTLTVQDTVKNAKPFAFMKLNIPLTNKQGDWTGNNMDDLYYHRVKINQPLFLKPGRYKFSLLHEMKEDPLKYIFNVGVSIEKALTSP